MTRTAVACALLVITLAMSAGFCAGAPLFERGKTVPVIIAPADDNAQSIAGTLKSYLGRMTGEQVRVISPGDTPDDTETPLILARPADMEELGGRIGGVPELHSEGFSILVRPGAYAIAGADNAGLQSGMYTLLERLGCRFYFPGDVGENVPQVESLTLPEGVETQHPDFVHRNVWWAYGSRPAWQRALYDDWRRKVGMGGVSASMGHNLYRIVPREGYAETHPEYFPLWDGERHIPAAGENHGWQPCTSNPEVIQLAVDAAIRYFDENPNAYSFSLSPNDGYGWCECDNCAAQDPVDMQGQANRGKGRRVLVFANKVAEALAEKHPDKYVAWYAYAGAVEPPTDVRAHPNVVTVVAHYGWCGCNTHPIEDPTCKLNAGFRDVLDGWAKVAGKIFIREYFTTLVEPTSVIARVAGAYSLAEDMRYFKSRNVIGVNSESVPDYGAAALNFYLAAKTMWDSDQDIDALKADWYEGMYGPAAEKMRQYTETTIKLVREQGCRGGYFVEDEIEQLTALLDEAAQLAQTEKQQARVDMCREAMDYMVLMREYMGAPRREVREQIAALMTDIEQGQRLSIDFVAHKSSMGRGTAVSTRTAAQYAGIKLTPAADEEVPDEALNTAFALRGTHGYAVLLKKGEMLKGTVSVRRLGRYLTATAWTLLDPEGKSALEGSASVEQPSELEYEAAGDGVYVLVTNSGSNACRVQIQNEHASVIGRDLHFLGQTPWLYFYVLPDVEEAAISMRTDAPGETARLIVRDPEGKTVYDDETGEKQSKLTVHLPVNPANVGKVWSARAAAASAGVCEDIMFSLSSGTGPCTGSSPGRVMMEER